VTLRGVPLSAERNVAASPVWLRLVDMFRSGAPVGPISVAVERLEAGQWRAVEAPHELKPSGDLAFVNLGRVQREHAGRQFNLRVTVNADGTVSETSNGAPSMVLTVTTWAPEAPPASPPVREIRLFPGPDYRYGPGVPLLSGRVTHANGDPAGRAQVWATETVLGNPLTEEVRANDAGWFRLPLRWSSGSTQVNADRSGASGSRTINVPADLASVAGITIS